MFVHCPIAHPHGGCARARALVLLHHCSAIDVSTIQYASKQREKQRKLKVKSKEAAAALESQAPTKRRREPSVAWSKQKDQKARKEKRRAKKAYDKKVKETNAPDEDEWDVDDLASEARMAKKLKQGKITKAAYEQHLMQDTL